MVRPVLKDLEIASMNFSFPLLSDNHVEWRIRTNEPLMDFFKETDWLRIFSDVTNVEDLEDFMNMDCGQCFVAYNPISNAPFGFVYVYVEDEQTKKVSIHGGGWLPNHALLNYRAYIMLIKTMLQQGFKVRTACKPDNLKAIRFNRGIGFVNHYTSKNYRYFWISEKRLLASPVYQWLMKKERHG